MEKFQSQQAALRAALTQVLGAEPVKGQLVITDEQRAAVGQLMLSWLHQGLWSIKEGTRAAAEPLMYITGRRPTDLIQAWVNPKKKEEKSGEVAGDKLALIKQAVDAGLMSKEQAQELIMKFLAA
jgi:hypothetical protein